MIVGIMGGGQRSGAWTPAKCNWAVGVMGGCGLDFREVQLGLGVTEIRALAIMGGVQVVVPPDVAIMGGVEVAVRCPGETPLDAQVRLKAERKAQRRIAKGK